MKQRISIEDLNQLSEEQKQRLREWWKLSYGDFYHRTINKKIDKIEFTCDDFDVQMQDKEHKIPALSIGQMIELLEYKGLKYIKPIIDSDVITRVESWDVCMNDEFWGKGKELADALWSAVKEVL